MKMLVKNSTLTICLICVLVYACGKKNPEPIQPTLQYGTITSLQVNDTLFSKQGMTLSVWAKKSNIANCPYTNNYDLFIEQKVNIGYYHERIGFSNLSTDKKGIFQIFSPNQLTCDSIVNVLASTADGDKVLNFYKPLRGQKNTITLTEYNKSTKEVSGTFDITLLIDFGTLDSRAIYPDTIRLYNCQFKTVIND